MQKYPETRNKMKIYGIIMIIQWSLTFLILGIFTIKGISLTELGFVSEFGEVSNFFLFVAGILASMVLMMVATIAIPLPEKTS